MHLEVGWGGGGVKPDKKNLQKMTRKKNSVKVVWYVPHVLKLWGKVCQNSICLRCFNKATVTIAWNILNVCM